MPIHVERLTGNRIQLTPAAYKFSDDPDRFVVATAFEQQGGLTHIRLTEAVSRVHVRQPDLKERILAHLAAGPAPSGSQVAKALQASKANVLEALEELKREGKVQSTVHGRPTIWALAARQ